MAPAEARKVAETDDHSKTESAEKPKFDILGIVILLVLCVNLAAVGGLGYFLKMLWSNYEKLEISTKQLQQKAVENDNGVAKRVAGAGLGSFISSGQLSG